MQCKAKSNKSTFRYLYYQELNQLVHTEYQITPFRIGKEVCIMKIMAELYIYIY